MHILYANQVTDAHLDSNQRRFLAKLSGNGISDGASPVSHASRPKDFNSAQDWVTAFFDKGAEEVLGYYADDFVWEDIEFMQTITTKEDLYKAFIVFNNSGPDSPFGVHKFEVLSFDGGKCGAQHAQQRPGGVPADFPPEVYKRYADNILLGSDFEYDEWGYMQWIWKATHNEDFFGIPAAGKTTYTRGTTTQFYRDGKIVRCRTHWNFREFAMQLGVIPFPDDAWRNNPGLPQN
jgi:SnoaL-like polyketide cyclase